MDTNTARRKAQEICLESAQALLRHVKKNPVRPRQFQCELNRSQKPNRAQMNMIDAYWQFIDEFNDREVDVCERRVRAYEDALARGV